TNLQFVGVGIKTVVITSFSSGEGKTTISFDLAKSLAESGKKVIFIDADMRKTSLVARLKIDNKGQKVGGLTHYLSGQIEPEDLICSTNINGLHMILAGPYSTNPTELLNGVRFEVMVRGLESSYDYVIIDAPPLGEVIDAAIIASKTDGAIVVMEANSIPTRAAQKMLRQLEASGTRVLGYVLNKVSSKSGYYSKYQYYGKYE
ncbi:MAG: CpsD/CapB family tyrosine-protein kinase, partial [Eubacteriales bacterium]|nr:CpsD/CapB family tyrosine-protein kinase [Eubacteriales bacterium]